MLLDQHQGMFRGALLLGDLASKESLYPQESDDAQVVAGTTVLAVRVQHEDDGSTEIYVWDRAEEAPPGVRAFSGVIRIDSGQLWVGDILRHHGIVVECTPGPTDVTVVLADPPWSPRVDLIIGSADPGAT